MNLEKEIFISYAWDDPKEKGESRERIVNELDSALEKKGIKIIRDKRDLGYKELIADFMIRIGLGKAIIVVISDKYLKSPYCMFELFEIFQNSRGKKDFIGRIFTIILDDATGLYDPIKRLEYSKFWKEKRKELALAIENYGIDGIMVVGDDFKIYYRIQHNFGDIINIIKDINSLTPNLHRQDEFEQLYEAILKKIDEESILPIHEPLLELLEQSKELCRKRDVPFRTPNFLFPILNGPTGFVKRVYDFCDKSNLFEKINDAIKFFIDNQETIEPTKKFRNLRWSEQREIQKANEEALKENAKFINEKHLLISILSFDTNTTKKIKELTGGFEKYNAMLKNIEAFAYTQSYKLTQSSLNNLRDSGVSKGVLEKLHVLIDGKFSTEVDFLKEIEKQIGSKHTSEYKILFLKYACNTDSYYNLM